MTWRSALVFVAFVLIAAARQTTRDVRATLRRART